MLALQLKKSTGKEVDFVKPIHTKIAADRSAEDADACNDSLTELNTLRNQARGVSDGGGKPARDQLLKYCQALETLHSLVSRAEESSIDYDGVEELRKIEALLEEAEGWREQAASLLVALLAQRGHEELQGQAQGLANGVRTALADGGDAAVLLRRQSFPAASLLC